MTEAPVQVGHILAGKYRIDRILGEGGMGVVVAATDLQLERHVAIKFLLEEYTAHQEAVTRFLREARAAVKIKSEHVARVIDVGTLETGAPYMVMEFLEGADLSAVVAERGPLPLEEATAYVLQACDAIAEAHAKGIVHRDLKPANLFLCAQPDGTHKIKVLDFGISKSVIASDTQQDVSLTRTSSMMGSPLYMSPEQMKSARDVDMRTDIWALGVILYELLAGCPPFDGNTIPELSAKVLLENPQPISARRAEIPVAIEEVLQKALQKDPKQRYPSVAEFAMALSRFAPKRTRHNVERIFRTLSAAGLSNSALDLPPSMPPVNARSGASPQHAPQARTAAAFGVTNGDTPKRRGGAVAAALIGGVVVLGAAVAFGWSRVSGGDVQAEPAAGEQTIQAAAHEKKVPSAATVVPDVKPAEPAEADQQPDSEEVAPDTPPAAPTARATATPSKKAQAKRVSRPQKTSTKSQSSSPPKSTKTSGASSSTTSFRGKFGGRK